MIEMAATAQRIEQQLETVFSEFGQRSTLPRQRIIELLRDLALTGEGFTVEDLWNMLKRNDPGIGRATVFRAVKKLVDSAVLDCVEFPDGTRLYRVCGERVSVDHAHHHHLACNHCHKVTDLYYCVDAETLEELAERQGFQIAGHSITLYGLCSDCQVPNHKSK